MDWKISGGEEKRRKEGEIDGAVVLAALLAASRLEGSGRGEARGRTTTVAPALTPRGTARAAGPPELLRACWTVLVVAGSDRASMYAHARIAAASMERTLPTNSPLELLSLLSPLPLLPSLALLLPWAVSSDASLLTLSTVRDSSDLRRVKTLLADLAERKVLR